MRLARHFLKGIPYVSYWELFLVKFEKSVWSNLWLEVAFLFFVYVIEIIETWGLCLLLIWKAYKIKIPRKMIIATISLLGLINSYRYGNSYKWFSTVVTLPCHHEQYKIGINAPSYRIFNSPFIYIKTSYWLW